MITFEQARDIVINNNTDAPSNVATDPVGAENSEWWSVSLGLTIEGAFERLIDDVVYLVNKTTGAYRELNVDDPILNDFALIVS